MTQTAKVKLNYGFEIPLEPDKNPLVCALEAVLLFHAIVLDPETRLAWMKRVGTTEITSKALCDFIRSKLEDYRSGL
jgi:hypothetical protein